MNDFLRNLRSAHKKDKSSSRRNLDGHYYPKEDRRQQGDRRLSYPENLESLFMTLQEVLPNLVDNTTNITDHMEKYIAQNDMLLEAKLKQLNSITTFFDNLNKIFSEEFLVPSSSQGSKFKTTTSYAVGTHYTKDEILNIIRVMRKKGSTFSLIAEYLRDKGIPTFSGRGEWHAQTIHRLCK